MMGHFVYPDEYSNFDDFINPKFRNWPVSFGQLGRGLSHQHFTDDARVYQQNLPSIQRLPENTLGKDFSDSRHHGSKWSEDYIPKKTPLEGDPLKFQMQNANSPYTPIEGVDAFRHILWQSVLAHRYNADIARAAGNFHETLNEDYSKNNVYASHNMDFNNNRYAWALAQQARREGKSLHDLPDMIAEAIRTNRPLKDDYGNVLRSIVNPWEAWHNGQISPEMAQFADPKNHNPKLDLSLPPSQPISISELPVPKHVPPSPVFTTGLKYVQSNSHYPERDEVNNWAVAGLANGVPAQGVKDPEPPLPTPQRQSGQIQMLPIYQQPPAIQQPTQSKPERLVPFTGLRATTWQPWHNLSTMDPGHPLYPITKKYIPFYDSLSQNKAPTMNPAGISGQEETVSSPKPPLPMGGTFAPVYDPTKRGDCHGFPHSETPTGPVMH